MQYLIATNSTDVIARNFNYDLLVVSGNILSHKFTDHFQIVNKPRQISRPLIDLIYIKKTMVEEFSGVVKAVTEKTAVGFYVIPYNSI